MVTEYMVSYIRIDKSRNRATYTIRSKKNDKKELSKMQLINLIKSGEIKLVNFKLEDNRLIHTDGCFTLKRTIPDSTLTASEYVACDKETIYDRHGNKIKVTADDLEYLIRAGRIKNGRFSNEVSYSKVIGFREDSWGNKIEQAEEISKEEYKNTDGIINIYCSLYTGIDTDINRSACRNQDWQSMEPRKFWSIVKQFNHGKTDYTAENIKQCAKEIHDKLYLYTWFELTEVEVWGLYFSTRDFEGAIHSHDCITNGYKKYFEAVPGSDDGFRQAMCSLLWLYGEQVCKEFIINPLETVARYKIPVDKLEYVYIMGY